MKRLSFLFTSLMVAALLLAACGGGSVQEQTPGAGTLAPDTGFGTETPDTGLDGMGTETATTEAGVSPTVEETGFVETATVPATEDAAGTPTLPADMGSVPGTGVSDQFVLLSELMAMPVNDQSGMQVGSVNGVVVNSAASDASGMDVETPVATTEAGAVDATETPAVDATPVVEATETDAGAGTGVAMGDNPSISYVVVNLTAGTSMDSDSVTAETPAATEDASTAAATATPDAGSSLDGSSVASNQVLVPWQSFTFTASGNIPATGSTDVMDAGTPTVAADMSSVTMDSTPGALTLTVDQSILASAPAFDAAMFTGTISPDVASYWSRQGLSIPATGVPSASDTAFLLQSPLTGLEVMDNSDQSLGQVQDFVVDTMTGELIYAVLSGGTTFGSDFYVVPMSALTWQSGSVGATTSASSMGQVQANVPSDAFASAPSIASLSELDLSSPNWQSNYDSYWNTVK